MQNKTESLLEELLALLNKAGSVEDCKRIVERLLAAEKRGNGYANIVLMAVNDFERRIDRLPGHELILSSVANATLAEMLQMQRTAFEKLQELRYPV